MKIFPSYATWQLPRPTPFRVLGQRSDGRGDGDLCAYDAVVEGLSGRHERADTRAGSVSPDEYVGDDDEAVGEGEFVSAAAFLERTHGSQGMAPLDRALGESSQHDVAEDTAVDLGAGLRLVLHVVLGATHERDAVLAADYKILCVEARVRLESFGETVLPQRALAFAPGEVEHPAEVRTSGAARLPFVERGGDAAGEEGKEGYEPAGASADNGDGGILRRRRSRGHGRNRCSASSRRERVPEP